MKYLSIIIVLFLCGCGLTYKNVPLTAGTMPYVLPPGTYIDIEGQTHEELKNRWSLSEEDLFKNSAPDFIDNPFIAPVSPTVPASPASKIIKINNILVVLMLICTIVLFIANRRKNK